MCRVCSNNVIDQKVCFTPFLIICINSSGFLLVYVCPGDTLRHDFHQHFYLLFVNKFEVSNSADTFTYKCIYY